MVYGKERGGLSRERPFKIGRGGRRVRDHKKPWLWTCEINSVYVIIPDGSGLSQAKKLVRMATEFSGLTNNELDREIDAAAILDTDEDNRASRLNMLLRERTYRIGPLVKWEAAGYTDKCRPQLY